MQDITAANVGSLSYVGCIQAAVLAAISLIGQCGNARTRRFVARAYQREYMACRTGMPLGSAVRGFSVVGTMLFGALVRGIGE
jgi:predicted small integral membrane protein